MDTDIVGLIAVVIAWGAIWILGKRQRAKVALAVPNALPVSDGAVRDRRSGWIQGGRIGIPLAALLSASSLLVVLYGAIGIKGNSIVTGLVFLLTLVTIFILTNRQFRLLPADYLFGVFVGWIAVSFVANGQTCDSQDWALMGLSLAAYPACRLISGNIGSTFLYATGALVAVGAVGTAWALVFFLNTEGRPVVFGFFGGAAVHFLISLGFLMLAFTTKTLTWRRTVTLSALIFLPTAIFAAAMVRFAFFAIVGSLVVVAIVTEARQRKHIATITLAFVVAAVAGLATRPEMTGKYSRYLIDAVTSEAATAPSAVAMSSATAAPSAVAKGVVAEPSATAAPSTAAPGVAAEPSAAAVPSAAAMPSATAAPSATAPGVAKAPGAVNSEILPSCYLTVDDENSVDIRKMLLRDAIFLLPGAGLVGNGLRSFTSMSCLKMDPHNSFLQAAVEFGWIGGLCLLALVVLAGAKLIPCARQDATARFVFGGLAFVVALSIFHGQITRDILLFGFIGWAVGIKELSSGLAAAGGSGEVANPHLISDEPGEPAHY
jgi:O-antigen ligase